MAVRSVARQPGLGVAAVVALSFGIGLTGAMFSLVRGSFRDLPFDESSRLMHLERDYRARGIEGMEVTLHDLIDWRRAQTSFDGLAAFYLGTANVSGDRLRPVRYEAAFISPEAFPMLRVEPLLGRTFGREEEGPAADAVVIFGHGAWQELFGGEPGVLQRMVRINGEAHTIIGVMPEGFEFPVAQDLWLPLRLDPSEIPRNKVDQRTLEVFGRLRDSVSRERAAAEMSSIAERLAEEHPDSNQGIGVVVKPYTEEFVDEQERRVLITMLAAVFGVLLIACANVANLHLARAVLRTRQIAVRSVLGARRGRLVTGILAEALVLAAPAVVLGIVIAWAAVRLLDRAIVGTDPPFWVEIDLAAPELAFVAGLGLVAALCAGLVPALRGSRVHLGEVLRDEGRGTSSLRLGGVAKALVGVEVMLSSALLLAAGLMIQSMINLHTLDHPYETEHVLTARLGLFEGDYPDEASRLAFFEEVEERLAALPGVDAVGLTTSPPGVWAAGVEVEIEGREYASAREIPRVRRAVVSPGFFDTVGTAVLLGRSFTRQDRADAPLVVVINRSFVEHELRGGQVLGRRVRLGGPHGDGRWRTVIGVAPDLDMAGLGVEVDQQGIYVPLSQGYARLVTLALRTRNDPVLLVNDIRNVVNSIDPNLPLYRIGTLGDLLAEYSWHYEVFGALFIAFGIAALCLATIGLYGVMAFTVSRRTYEFGIRMALGARRIDVVRTAVLGKGLLHLALGLSLGLLLALILSRTLPPILFQVEPLDPAVLLLVIATLAGAGTAACLIPVLHVTRLDPATALRHQ